MITKDAVKRLGLTISKASVNLTGLKGRRLPTANGRVKLTLRSTQCYNLIKGMFYVVDGITKNTPRHEVNPNKYPEFSGLTLADPHFGSPKTIDILFGLDIWVKILADGIVRSEDGLAAAQNSKFGWIIFQGETSQILKTNREVLHVAMETEDTKFEQLNTTLQKFWEVEALPSGKLLTVEEKECERIFTESHSRMTDGRYIVYLPLTSKIKLLGNSKHIALKQFLATERRMLRNHEFRDKYVEFMRTFEELNHMTRIQEKGESGYYTPHHGVTSSTKFRVVFNASCTTSSGISLNDCQLVGEKLQNDLQHTFLRFRRGQIALTADIVKMYRQIEINDIHKKYQKILWRSTPNENVGVYQINRVMYGQAAAPFLAVRAMQQCALDHQGEFPLGAEAVLHSFYVDDMLACTDSVDQARKIKEQIVQLLRKGQFELSKWCSNNRTVDTEHGKEYIDFGFTESRYPMSDQSKSMEILSEEAKSVLGLRWLPRADNFVFTVKPIEMNQNWTKRKILSEIGKLYDPSGFIAPTIITAKIIIQQLWMLELDWDDSVPEPILTEWISFLGDLLNLQEIKIPRWLGMKAIWQTDFHFFSDASENAYAAVAYAQTIRSDGKITVELIQSKTRVAPLKRLSVPRLELCGAFLASGLLKLITEQFDNNFKTCHLWSDSGVVLAWIKKPPTKLKTFVGNRVAAIQSRTTDHGYEWHWVAGEENPADLASRGINSQALKNDKLWWNGPKWLQYDEKMWPKMEPRAEEIGETISSELKTVLHITTGPIMERGSWFQSGKQSPIVSLLKTCSRFTRLQRNVATVLRAINNFKGGKMNRLIGPLTSGELEGALMTMIRVDQYQTFRKKVDDYNSNEVPTDGTMWLEPETKVLRLSGRITSENLSYDEQHPIILSPKGDLAPLLISEAHSKTLHGGVQQVLQVVRQRFWIFHARQLARKLIHKCVVCMRHRAKLGQQLMATLPSSRTRPSRPFKISGVDYMGPVGILMKIGRSPRIYKGYVCVFVCFATRAIHLELVSDISTAQFMQALRRMIGRRGPVAELWSDNGTNFVGANNELARVYNKGILTQTVSEEFRIKWHFITPRAPHHGGLHEAAVKSVKKHLNRVIGAQNLTYEEYGTLLVQVEACVNSRPIAPLSDDPMDLNALTPAHFLVGEPLVTLVEPSDLTGVRTTYLKRWQLVQQMYQHFWQRWHDEYIMTLANRPKWRQRERNFQVGDLVLVKEENVAPSHWSLGRIKQTFPGPDGLVRSVLVNTINGDFKRPITKLGLLLENLDESIDLSSLRAQATFPKLGEN